MIEIEDVNVISCNTKLLQEIIVKARKEIERRETFLSRLSDFDTEKVINSHPVCFVKNDNVFLNARLIGSLDDGNTLAFAVSNGTSSEDLFKTNHKGDCTSGPGNGRIMLLHPTSYSIKDEG